MRRVQVKLKPGKRSHNGWTRFLLRLRIGDAFAIPDTQNVPRMRVKRRRDCVRFMARRAGVHLRTWTTVKQGLWGQRIG